MAFGSSGGSFPSPISPEHRLNAACTSAPRRCSWDIVETEQGGRSESAAMAKDRMRRVNEAVREVLGVAIGRDLKDPRIGFVTVTAVDTSPDLRHARVYVSVLGDEERRAATLAG